jgi:hypothetical protein
LATRGRASYLGERSIGHMDPGARSSQIIIEALSHFPGRTNLSENVALVIVSHSPDVAKGTADMVRQMIGEVLTQIKLLRRSLMQSPVTSSRKYRARRYSMSTVLADSFNRTLPHVQRRTSADRETRRTRRSLTRRELCHLPRHGRMLSDGLYARRRVGCALGCASGDFAHQMGSLIEKRGQKQTWHSVLPLQRRSAIGVRRERRRFPVGASPTRRTLQPEATGAVMEVTKWLKPSV